MKKNWTIGFFGIVIILLNFVGFPAVVRISILMAIGVAISFVSFRAIIKDKIALRLRENDESQKKDQTNI